MLCWNLTPLKWMLLLWHPLLSTINPLFGCQIAQMCLDKKLSAWPCMYCINFPLALRCQPVSIAVDNGYFNQLCGICPSRPLHLLIYLALLKLCMSSVEDGSFFSEKQTIIPKTGCVIFNDFGSIIFWELFRRGTCPKVFLDRVKQRSAENQVPGMLQAEFGSCLECS